MGITGTLGTYFGSGGNKSPEKLGKNVKIFKKTVDNTPESKFKKASMVDKSGERRMYNRAQVKKEISGMVRGGITTTKLDKDLTKKGMAKKQISIRKGVVSELAKRREVSKETDRAQRGEAKRNNLKTNLNLRLRDEGISKLLAPSREDQAREKIEKMKHSTEEEQEKETVIDKNKQVTIDDYSNNNRKFSMQKDDSVASVVQKKGSYSVSTGTTVKAKDNKQAGSLVDPLGVQQQKNKKIFKMLKNQKNLDNQLKESEENNQQ